MRSLRAMLIAILLLALVVPASVACQLCVPGGDQRLYCKDPVLYSEANGALYAGCKVEVFCYRMPGQPAQCFEKCAGDPCFLV